MLAPPECPELPAEGELAASTPPLAETLAPAQPVQTAPEAEPEEPALGAPEAAAAQGAAASAQSFQDSLTCAICLDQIAPWNLAQIPLCGHSYCVNCILFWATRKERAWCPQCRVEFSQLSLYRSLDGQPRELPGLESLCLLKRASWFQEYALAREQGLNPAAKRLLTEHDAADHDASADVHESLAYEQYWQDYDDDEEVEAYYHSAAAGSARITLGNRRWGENGYVSAGRMRARPVGPVPSKTQRSKGGKAPAKQGTPARQPAGSSHAGPAGRTGPSSSPVAPAAAAAAAGPSSGPMAIPRGKGKGKGRSPAQPVPGADWEDDLAGTSPGGRRARRNARRAAMDGLGGSPC